MFMNLSIMYSTLLETILGCLSCLHCKYWSKFGTLCKSALEDADLVCVCNAIYLKVFW
jgi:hypothetical protein